MLTNTQFKRVAIGAHFTTAQGAFRKASNKGAFAIREDGRGQTHAQVRFSRSAAVKADAAAIVS